MKNKHIGSSFESFLEEEGIREEVDGRVRKRILADEIRESMKRRKITPSEMARRMGTSRSVVYDSLLSSDAGVTLDVLERASAALGMDLIVKIVDRRRQPLAAKRSIKPRAA
jgi:antitoxin HicB